MDLLSTIDVKDVNQCYVSDHLKYFKMAFLTRYKLKDYFNKSAACIFLGVLNNKDLITVQQHTGKKYILLEGGEVNILNIFNR